MTHSRHLLSALLLSVGLVSYAATSVFAPIQSAADLKAKAGSCQVVFVYQANATTWYAPYLYSPNTYTRNADISSYMATDGSRLELDLTNATQQSYVWTIRNATSQVQSYSNTDQYWGATGTTDAYLCNYSATDYPDWMRTYRLPASTTGGSLFALPIGDNAPDDDYKYLAYYSTTRTSMVPQSAASNYTVYRLAHVVQVDDQRLSRFAAVDTRTQYVFDSIVLPVVTMGSTDYASFIAIDGYYDAADNYYGMPGEKAEIVGNTRLELRYHSNGSSFLWSAFSLGDELAQYATLIVDTLYSFDNTLLLPTPVWRDARYATHITVTGWADENGTILGAPGDRINVTTNLTLHPVFTRLPFTVTLRPGYYGTCGDTIRPMDFSITLPAITWNEPTMASRLQCTGWYTADGTLFGTAGQTVNLYDDVVLYARYAALGGDSYAWFARVQDARDLVSQNPMQLILLNTYSTSTWYAATSYAQQESANTGYNYVAPTATYYTAPGSSTTANWVALAKDKQAFQLDISTPAANADTYNNQRFVWTVSEADSTLIRGYNGAWASYPYSLRLAYSSYPYIYTRQPGYNGGANDGYLCHFRLIPDSAESASLIEWAEYGTNTAYRFVRYNNSSRFSTGALGATYSTWNIYRRAYRVGCNADNEIQRYGTCISEALVFDSLTLPVFRFTHADYANNVTILGWADENGVIIGQPGDRIEITRNMDLQLRYTIRTYTVTFDAGDHGTCGVTSQQSLLPFALPAVVAESGWFFQGWASSLTGQLVGTAGETYPHGVNTLTMDDDLYAVYLQSYDVQEWGVDNLMVEFLYSAVTVRSKTENGTALTTPLADCLVDKGLYRIPVHPGDLSADEGQILTLTFYDAQGVVVSSATARIPVIVADDQVLSDEHDYSICAATDLVVLNGGVARAGSVPYSFLSIRVQGGGKLVIPQGTVLSTSALYMQFGTLEDGAYQSRHPQVVANGQLNNTSGRIYLDYMLNEDQYYTLSLPYDVPVSAVSYRDGTRITLGTNLWVAVYDGARRATGASGWGDFNGSTFHAGIGYTIAATPPTVRIVGGSPVRRNYATLRFPMTADLTTGEISVNKQVSVSPYPASTGKDNDAGWNLVGNPYLADYSGAVDGLSSNGIGLLVQDGMGSYEWEGALRYVVIPNSDGTSYAPVLASAASLPAFRNFFVQVGTGDALSFLLANRAQNAPVRLLTVADEPEYSLALTLTSATASDHMGLLISDRYTDDYEINADLQKWLNYRDRAHQVPDLNLYAWAQGEPLAYIALPAQSAQAVHLGYHLPEFGTYTFALDSAIDRTPFAAIYLTDHKRNRTVNLLTDSYSFSVGTAVTDNTRFTLSAVLRSHVTTDLVDGAGSAAYVLVGEGGLQLCGLPDGTALSVYDLTGRCVTAATAGAGPLTIPLPAGTYLITTDTEAPIMRVVVP